MLFNKNNSKKVKERSIKKKKHFRDKEEDNFDDKLSDEEFFEVMEDD